MINAWKLAVLSLTECNGCVISVWRCHYEASFQTECHLHCSLTTVQQKVKCFSGEKMCLMTPSQVVTCFLKSLGSFFTQAQVGWIGQRGGLISDSLLGMWCHGPKIQSHSLQQGRKWIELPSGPWAHFWACLYPGCKKYFFLETRKWNGWLLHRLYIHHGNIY